MPSDIEFSARLKEARDDLIAYIETTFPMLEAACSEEGIDDSIGPNGEPPYTAKSTIALVDTLYRAAIKEASND